MAQALVRFLAAQYVERDGVEHRFFEGCFGIFGHGNLTGVGQALAQDPDLLTYYQARNEQAMVHTAAGFARMRNRLGTLACTTSIGPGATNMVTGAATLAPPQDVQTEAYDYPDAFFEKRIWHRSRPLPDASILDRAAGLIRSARQPLIIAGGGVIYSEATEVLRKLVRRTGIPVVETQAGKGSLPFDHPGALGAIGATGTPAANQIAAEADLVLGVGTRYSDFATASRTAFQNPEIRFVNVNIAELDSHKLAGVALTGDARATLEALDERLRRWTVSDAYQKQYEQMRAGWDHEVSRLFALGHAPLPAQSEVIGAVNDLSAPRDVVVCAAGSMPGDLHKLWRTRDAKGYHVEYGYSTMGYEIAGGLGVKLADPSREVYVMVGDGSYLMMNSEIVTTVQEGIKLIIVLVDNHGFNSIGGLSRSLGMDGLRTQYRFRKNGSLGLDSDTAPGDVLPIDLAANAASLGAEAVRVRSVDELRGALERARQATRTSVISIEVDRYEGVPNYESWWDVPLAEVATVESVRAARREYEKARKKEQRYL